MKYYFFIAVCSVTSLLSCGSRKDVVYFQNIQNEYSRLVDSTESKVVISRNDILMINVYSINAEAAAPFNMVNTDHSSTNASSLELLGYLVDENGEINFPLLGKIKIAGLTKPEAIDLLQGKITSFIDNPVVNVRFLNYKITVLGEVARPGTYSITDEKISIPEALSLAGDLTIYGERHNVLLMRTDNWQKEVFTIDLTKPETVFSPQYFLKQNDILYVSPNRTRIRAASIFNQNVSIAISLVSITMTLIAFFGLKQR
ncbi:MAG: polysaccharide biosynthesis/export family protein [Dysgonamonadaceae bacterium]|jgi:polysaccharide export outer membrane protein|nr:polysaccharide biosynthesis/export family protein [Dysgonamonadaceae bacterium]